MVETLLAWFEATEYSPGANTIVLITLGVWIILCVLVLSNLKLTRTSTNDQCSDFTYVRSTQESLVTSERGKAKWHWTSYGGGWLGEKLRKP